MLILTRRIGETLVINNDVNVSVLGVKGNQVRLGIKAPKHISIHREEIQQRIDSEREAGMSDKERLYKGMIQELVDEGLYDFSKVDPARAEDIAWAKFGIADDSADLLYEAEDWHCDARVAALQNGQYHEAYRLTRDGMRIIMGERYDSNKKVYVKGPVQIDLDAAAEADRFNRKMEISSGLTKAAFNGEERV